METEKTLTRRYDLLDTILRRCAQEGDTDIISMVTRWQTELLDQIATRWKLKQKITAV